MNSDTPESASPNQTTLSSSTGARWRRARAAILALLAGATVLLAAAPAVAQGNEQAYRFYEDALARYERKDVSGAVVQLKNALQQDPKLLAAYVLLGKAQLAQGDSASAEEAFSRALSLGVDRSEIAIPLARALLAQGKHQALLERLPAEAAPIAQRPALLTVRGSAHKAMGDAPAARRAFEDARAIDSRYVPAILALAELAAEEGKRSEAERKLPRQVDSSKVDITPRGASRDSVLAAGFPARRAV